MTCDHATLPGSGNRIEVEARLGAEPIEDFVDDLDRAVAFYRDLLGCEVVERSAGTASAFTCRTLSSAA